MNMAMYELILMDGTLSMTAVPGMATKTEKFTKEHIIVAIIID